jgi:hypothetical protein
LRKRCRIVFEGGNDKQNHTLVDTFRFLESALGEFGWSAPLSDDPAKYDTVAAGLLFEKLSRNSKTSGPCVLQLNISQHLITNQRVFPVISRTCLFLVLNHSVETAFCAGC